MQMALSVVILLVLLKLVSSSAPTAHIRRASDLPLAMSNMRSQSYYGFVILLDMLNATTKASLSQQATFLMPSDEQLGQYTIPPSRLEEFIVSHTIPKPLVFSDLAHVPSGTLIPSVFNNRLLRIARVGRRVFVNNAQIVTPNVCSSATIKCHGISSVISSRNEIMDHSATTAASGAKIYGS
ncbi:hypothetical protein IFM89_021846 [Coptis chinensis]|uniref:FAS1 domain-containing protein n=1 Tax=Coptis chinensis TaxID=261450 RepID=A0A835LWM8_9MAGN|nr:hypothetical protein IFM89_021846 [Coptis chinensis]